MGEISAIRAAIRAFTADSSSARDARAALRSRSAWVSSAVPCAASPRTLTSAPRRVGWVGSMSIVASFSASGRGPQRNQASSMREPIPSTTSVCAHSSKPSAQLRPR